MTAKTTASGHALRGVSPGKAAEIYGVSRGLIHRLIREKKLYPAKWFRRTVIPIDQLEALLNPGAVPQQENGNAR